MRSPDSSPRVSEALDGLAAFVDKVRRGERAGLVGTLIRPWLPQIALALLLSAVHGFAMTFQTLTPKWLITDVLGQDGASAADMFRSGLKLIALFLVVSLVGRMLLWHIACRILTHARERIIFVLRTHFFRHVNYLCLRFHGRHDSGELLSYILGSPMNAIMTFYSQVSLSAPGHVFAMVSTILTMAFWDVYLSLTLVILGGLSGYGFRRTFVRMRAVNTEFQDVEADVVGNVADMMRGARAIKVYTMEEKVAREFDRDAFAISRIGYRRDIKRHVEYMKQETTNYLVYSLVILTAIWRYQHGVDVGVIAAFLTAFATVTGYASGLLGMVADWSACQASVDRITEVLTTPTSTPDPEGDAIPVPSDGAIEFRSVDFRYDDEREPVLRGFDLSVPYGQTIALVGPSGSGKSTIAQLILRLYDPQAGEVCIGKASLRQARCYDLRRQFGVVPQDPFIFQTTIRENVRVAAPGASDEQIVAACQMANAWEFIEGLPNRLDERVGEGGVKLSGGQRQRLAVARALLHGPSYFIFDEATSALDTMSERLIQEALEKNLAGRTVVFIAHRLSTVKSCDRIVVLDDGKILQDGAYDELVAAPGMFRDMVERQALL